MMEWLMSNNVSPDDLKGNALVQKMSEFSPSNRDDFEALTGSIRQRVFNKGMISPSFEINNIIVESIVNGFTTVPIGMPEVLLRLKLGNELSLDQLEDIFNTICNKINQGKCAPNAQLAS